MKKFIPKKLCKNKNFEKGILVKLSTKKGYFWTKNAAKPCKRKVVHNKGRGFIHNFFKEWVDNPYLSTKKVENGVLRGF